MSHDPRLQPAENGSDAFTLGSLDLPTQLQKEPDASVAGQCPLESHRAGLREEVKVRACPQDTRRHVNVKLCILHSVSPLKPSFKECPRTEELQCESGVKSKVISRQSKGLCQLFSRTRSVAPPCAAIGTRPAVLRTSHLLARRVPPPFISTRDPAAHVFRARLVKIGRRHSGFAHVCGDEAHRRELAKAFGAPLHFFNQAHLVSPSLPDANMRAGAGAVYCNAGSPVQ